MCNHVMTLFLLRPAARRAARSAAFTACLLAAAQAWALTLGPARGAALIGRPLDLLVPISRDADSDPDALCLEPEVFYGDTHASGGVSARVETGAGTQASIRVRSESPVDETVVTVYLRVGCDQKVTRRFVLFAEPPGEAVTSPTPVVAAAPAVAARSAAAASAPAPGAVAAIAAGTAPASAARKAAGPRVEPKKAVVRETAAPRPRARLKLEPLDLGIEHDPRLKSTLSIDTVPQASAQRRAEALALWQALAAQPEDVLRSSQRLQALEGDVQSLRDAVMKDRANLAEVRGELVKARQERYANFVVYGLAIALLLAAALAAWAWRRSPREAGPPGRDWWRRPAAAAATDFNTGPSTQGPTDAAAPATAPVPPARPKEPDLGFSESMLESVRAQAAVRAVPPRVPFKVSARGEFADSFGTQAGGMRSVKAEELHDLQQQADFFVSLGEYDRAIEVLRSHIYVNPETSALAWLDLLGIYHQLQRKDDYEWVRGEFNRVFNAQAPAFDRYDEDEGGLESYQPALSRIVALWPSPRVLDVIEESIFRKPGRDGSEAFSLQAYRELLMLHSLAKDIIEAGDAPVDFVTSSQPASFSPTSLEALSARLMTPSAPISRLALDIDLDEPAPPSPDLMEVGAADATLPPGNLLDFHLPDLDSEPPVPWR